MHSSTIGIGVARTSTAIRMVGARYLTGCSREQAVTLQISLSGSTLGMATACAVTRSVLSSFLLQTVGASLRISSPVGQAARRTTLAVWGLALTGDLTLVYLGLTRLPTHQGARKC